MAVHGIFCDGNSKGQEMRIMGLWKAVVDGQKPHLQMEQG